MWKQTVLIGPDPEKADLERLEKTGWHYGFRVREDGNILKAQYCKLLNVGYSSTLVLRGSRDFDAIGLDPDNLDEIPLAGIQLFRRGVSLQ